MSQDRVLIEKYVIRSDNWSLNNDYHFGGYGKISESLVRFINKFRDETEVPLDPVYTGKMIYGLIELIKNDYFKPETKIIAVHTGGLQGIDGMNAVLAKRKMIQLKTN